MRGPGDAHEIPGVVEILFQPSVESALDGSADPAGQAGWVNALQAGLMDEQIIDQIVGSDEYFFKF